MCSDEVTKISNYKYTVKMNEPASAIRPHSRGPQQPPSELEPTNFLDPLLSEYDGTVRFLMEEIEKYKNEQGELKDQIMKLINENRRLVQELKENVEVQMTSGKREGIERVQNLEHQLHTVTEAKTTLLEMWHIALQEIERLEKLLHEKRDGTEVDVFEERMIQVKEQYMKALNALNTELSEARNDLRNTKNELQAKDVQLNEMKKAVESNKEILNFKEREVTTVSDERQAALSKALDAEAELADATKRLASAEEEASQLQQKIEELQGLLTDLNKQISHLKAREAASLKEARESLVAAEDAVLQKEEANFREQQAIKEVQQLKSSIKQLVEQAASQTNAEIENVKKKYNDKIQVLMEEIHTLELENSEKQTQVERAMREKRAAETELETLYKENLDGSAHSSPLFEDLCRRLTQAERSRDEAQLKVQSLESELKRLQLSYHQEIAHYQSECKSLKERLYKLQAEFTTTSTEKVHLVDQVEKLDQKFRASSEELATVKKKFNKDLAASEQLMQQQQKQNSQTLQNMEQSYQTAISELRSLLDAQLRMSNKWKDESSELTIKFESKLKDMYEELANLQTQNEELQRSVKEHKAKYLQAEREASCYAAEVNRLQMQMKEKS